MVPSDDDDVSAAHPGDPRDRQSSWSRARYPAKLQPSNVALSENVSWLLSAFVGRSVGRSGSAPDDDDDDETR